MEQDKILLGKILGEMYRTQKKLDCCQVSDAHIYGLLNGFEDSIEEELASIGSIPQGKVDVVVAVLNEIWIDQNKSNKFSGFYDIENKLQEQGVSRGEAKIIITVLKARGSFESLIQKMDSQNSPTECRHFDLNI